MSNQPNPSAPGAGLAGLESARVGSSPASSPQPDPWAQVEVAYQRASAAADSVMYGHSRDVTNTFTSAVSSLDGVRGHISDLPRHVAAIRGNDQLPVTARAKAAADAINTAQKNARGWLADAETKIRVVEAQLEVMALPSVPDTDREPALRAALEVRLRGSDPAEVLPQLARDPELAPMMSSPLVKAHLARLQPGLRDAVQKELRARLLEAAQAHGTPEQKKAAHALSVGVTALRRMHAVRANDIAHFVELARAG